MDQYKTTYSLNEQGINPEKLKEILGKMFGTKITRADCQSEQLHGGTLGDVRLITGTAETANGEKRHYKVVWKTQKKWERFGDSGSWRREYDLYLSDLRMAFTPSFRWPDCYYAEMNCDETESQLWMEYIDGVSGLDLTGDMFERAAEELGRFQGKLYAEQPEALKTMSNLSNADAMKNFYLHYRSWSKVYDYVRSDDSAIPKHLCEMIISADNNADNIWSCVETLPVVFCHRDFWVTNIFFVDGNIVLIDWDTTGWGYMGEDIISLIADEADVDHMVEYYRKCVPAYCRGFSDYADIAHITDLFIHERIILHFGYRLVEWYLDADTNDKKELQINTLQKIYEMKS